MGAEAGRSCLRIPGMEYVMTTLQEQAQVITCGLEGSAPYVQVFIERTWSRRVDLMGGEPTRAALRCTSGVGVTIGGGGQWRFFSAAQSNMDRLCDWIEHVGGRSLKIGPIRGDEGVPDPVCAAAQEAAKSEVGCDERLVLENSHSTLASVTNDGPIRLETRTSDRRRAFACLTSPNGLHEGRSRWHASLRSAEHPIDWSAATALSEARRQAQALAAGVSIGTKRTAVLFSGATGAAFLHELIGHGLEADNLVRPGPYSEALKARAPWLPLGLKIRDDPRAFEGFVSLGMDDEGEQARPTTLVDEGAVQSQLGTVRHRGAVDVLMVPRARRESYEYPALPRASNTIVADGYSTWEELLAPDGSGVLVVHAMAGGHVDPATGEYSFSVSEAQYFAPRGSIVPLAAIRLVGSAIDALKEIEGIGRSPSSDSAICGKGGQELPIGFVSPSLRFRSLTWIS